MKNMKNMKNYTELHGEDTEFHRGSRLGLRVTLCLLCAALCNFASAQTNDQPSAISHQALSISEAQWLLISCVSRLPSEPYVFTGVIVMRKAYGVELKRLKFKSTISWNPTTSYAEYDISSAKGELLETVRSSRRGRVFTLTRTVGANREAAEPPNLNDTIQGTDVTWLDAMMDFVWWTKPEITGTDRVKGRNSTVVKVHPSEPVPGCAYVKVWIDDEQSAVLQAMQVNEKFQVTKNMWVRSIQKIDDQWIVKDIEVETPGTGNRTKITVETVKQLNQTNN